MADASEAKSQDRPRLGDLLISAGVIDAAQLKVALTEQTRWDTPLGMTLVRLGFLDEQTMVRALASQLNIPVVALRAKRINSEILQLVTVDLADKYRCLPLLLDDKGDACKLFLAMEDPTDEESIAELRDLVGMPIQPVLAAPTELDEGIHRHYHWDSTAIGSMGVPVAVASNSGPQEPLNSVTPVLPPLDTDAPDERFEIGHEQPQLVDYGVAAKVGSEEREVLQTDAEGDPAPRQSGRALDGSDAMLRAIAQLLIEKGVFKREEFVDRLRTVTHGGNGSG